MGYAVYHCEKGNVSSGGIGNHIDRTEGAEHTYQHADPERRELNRYYEINKHTSKPLWQAIEDRIAEGYNARNKQGELKEIRKDAVKYTTHILTGSHTEMMEIFSDEKKMEAWIHANIHFLGEEFGEENIVRFTLHMDEKTPHIHAVTVNLTKDGRLSAKELIGNRKQMQERQDRYAERMEQFGLKRGLKNTGIKHEDAKEYYKRMNEALVLEDDGNSLEVRDTLFGVDFGINNTKTRENFKNANLSLKTALKEKSRSLAEVKKQNERLNSRNISLSTEIAELKKQLEATQKEKAALQHRINNPSEVYLRNKLAVIEKEKYEKMKEAEIKRKQEEEAKRLRELYNYKIWDIAKEAVKNTSGKYGSNLKRTDIDTEFQNILELKEIPNVWEWKEIDRAINHELKFRGITLQQEEQQQERPKFRLRR